MLRRIFPLLLALTLVLCACAKQPDPVAPDPVPDLPADPVTPPQEERQSIALAELDVEFVIGERSVDDLVALQQRLPELLTAALLAQDVTVGALHVTFGTSAEATAEALRAGSVQVGFLPAETFFAHEDALRLAAVGLPGRGAAIVCDGTAAGESIRAAAAGGTLTWEMLAGASWCVYGEGALSWLDAYLAEGFAGHSADELDITRLPDRPDGGFAMNDVAYDLSVVPFSPEDGAPADAIAGAVLYDETAVVSAADETARSAAFVSAFSAALEDESLADALTLYGVKGFRADAGGTLLADTRLVYDRGQSG